MEVHARVPAEPAANGRTLVRAQIAEHDLSGLRTGRGRVDPIEQPDECLRVARARGPLRAGPRRAWA